MPTLPAIIDARRATQGATEFRRATRDMTTASREAERGLKRGRDELGRFTKGSGDASTAVTKLHGSLRKLGVGISLAVAIREVIQFGRSISDAAANTEEIRSKFDVVFGDAADDVREFAEVLGDDVGRSSIKLEQALAGLQDTFVPIGIARDESVELSKAVAQLALDLASFNNVADDDALRDLQSAIVGNTETVRKYGIVITETRLKQEAYKLGITDQARELTEQEKILARVALLQKDSTAAQGDAARTAGSFTNQMKRLDDALFDVRAELGEDLNEEILVLIDNMGGVEGVVDRVRPVMQTLADVLVDTAENVGSLAGAWEDFQAIQAGGGSDNALLRFLELAEKTPLVQGVQGLGELPQVMEEFFARERAFIDAEAELERQIAATNAEIERRSQLSALGIDPNRRPFEGIPSISDTDSASLESLLHGQGQIGGATTSPLQDIIKGASQAASEAIPVVAEWAKLTAIALGTEGAEREKAARGSALIDAIREEAELVGMTNDERRRSILLRELEAETAGLQRERVKGFIDVLNEELDKLEAAERSTALAQNLGFALTDPLRQAVHEWQGFEDFLMNMASRVRDAFLEALVFSPLQGAITSFVQPLTGAVTGASTKAAMGGHWSQGHAMPFANGGSGNLISIPTLFQLAGGGKGVAGEETGAGELILPAVRSTTGRVGIAAPGAGGSGGDDGELVGILRRMDRRSAGRDRFGRSRSQATEDFRRGLV